MQSQTVAWKVVMAQDRIMSVAIHATMFVKHIMVKDGFLVTLISHNVKMVRVSTFGSIRTSLTEIIRLCNFLNRINTLTNLNVSLDPAITTTSRASSSTPTTTAPPTTTTTTTTLATTTTPATTTPPTITTTPTTTTYLGTVCFITQNNSIV